MKIFVKKLGLLIVLSTLILSACASTPKVDWDLTVSGAVSNPLTVSYKELAKMPQIDLQDVFMDKSTGEDSVGSWSGVLLDGLLEQASAAADFATITAIAADG